MRWRSARPRRWRASSRSSQPRGRRRPRCGDGCGATWAPPRSAPFTACAARSSAGMQRPRVWIRSSPSSTRSRPASCAPTPVSRPRSKRWRGQARCATLPAGCARSSASAEPAGSGAASPTSCPCCSLRWARAGARSRRWSSPLQRSTPATRSPPKARRGGRSLPRSTISNRSCARPGCGAPRVPPPSRPCPASRIIERAVQPPSPPLLRASWRRRGASSVCSAALSRARSRVAPAS